MSTASTAYNALMERGAKLKGDAASQALQALAGKVEAMKKIVARRRRAITGEERIGKNDATVWSILSYEAPTDYQAARIDSLKKEWKTWQTNSTLSLPRNFCG